MRQGQFNGVRGEGMAYGSELCLRCSGVEEMLARLSAFGLFLR